MADVADGDDFALLVDTRVVSDCSTWLCEMNTIEHINKNDYPLNINTYLWCRGH